MNGLSEHGLTQCVVDVAQLILNLLCLQRLRWLELRLDHTNYLRGFPVSHVLLDSLYHGPMREHHDAEADYLGDLSPHKAYGDHLTDKECQKELSYLAVKVLGDCEFGDRMELHHATEECKQGQ